MEYDVLVNIFCSILFHSYTLMTTTVNYYFSPTSFFFFIYSYFYSCVTLSEFIFNKQTANYLLFII